MKKYFSIEESLLFLNKSLDESEKLNIRDLFQCSAENRLQPCFYFNGHSLWIEEKDPHYKGKIYDGHVRGYFSVIDMGMRLLDSLNNNHTNLEIAWAKEVDLLTTYTGYGANHIRLITYEDFTSDALREAFGYSGLFSKGCTNKIMDSHIDGEFMEYVFYHQNGVTIDFKDIYFLKQDLILLLDTTNGLHNPLTKSEQENKILIEDKNLKTDLPSYIKEQFQYYISCVELMSHISESQGKSFSEVIKLFSFNDVAEIPIYKKRDDWKIIKVNSENNNLFQLLNNFVDIDYKNIDQCKITFEKNHKNNLDIIHKTDFFYWKIEDILNFEFIQPFRVKKYIEWQVFHASNIWINLRTQQEIDQDHQLESLKQQQNLSNCGTPTIEDLNAEIARLKQEMVSKDQTIAELQQKNGSLGAENAINDIEISLKNSELLFIAVLLKKLQSAITTKRHKSQNAILQSIETEYGVGSGLSKSTTDKIMKKANGIYKSLITNKMP
ncbi:hypothetical protein [Acinetobacter sp. SwsAc4]|uniref:hypothetical protein n=1 Tax=Acinetobacter sp. SwsAc4 TaxID=2749437 RepID=UPI0015BAEF0E|nr:hypothetical protein [Acinetobacter sp. SwsAc4]NWK80824.1 hypothetical protein [Acinetobacter sp. SwsAc4]